MKYLLQTLFIIILAGTVSPNLQARPDTTCFATIQTVQGGFCLQVVAEGVSPFTYTWDDGSVLDYTCPNAFGQYCVTITDADGCAAVACDMFGNSPQDSCSVYITEEIAPTETILYANASGTMPLTFEWNTGEIGSEILAVDDGQYCVTITDIDGCVSTDCYTISTNNSPCDVWIEVDTTGAGAVLTANTNIITDDYMFYWNSNNAAGGVLQVTESGTYCVIVTSASCPNGADTACVTISLPVENDCGATIYDGSPNGSNGIYADAYGTPPFTYNWSTGELTQGIQPTQEGEYCITITDADGCYDYDCYYYSLNPVDSCGVFISGQNGNASGFLSAIANGNDPLTYIWSTGENTADIIVQDEGEYCVSVIDAVGCVAADCYYYTPFQDTSCYVYLTPVQNGYCLQATTVGNGNYEYLWDNGFTGDTYCSSDWGTTYCVTIVDVNTGCSATACGILTDPNVDSCGVFIDIISNPLYDDLSAIANGTAPFSYIWSTGASTQNISVFFEDNYCVTIIDALNCEATECFYYIPNNQDTFCYINNTLLASGDYELTAYGQPNAVSTYQWDDGSTAQSITVSPGDLACVTVTDQNGNICEDCYEAPIPQHNIWGNVYLTDSLNNPNYPDYGIAYLYNVATLGTPATLIAIDTFSFWNANAYTTYYFPNVEPGDYIIQAEVFTDDYVPTYHEYAIFWDEATIVTLPNYPVNSSQFDVYLIPTDGLDAGLSGINGIITDGDNLVGHEEDDRSAENPIEGVTVFAIDMNGNIAGFDVTDETGYYNIVGLAGGTYSLCLDYPGQAHFCEMVNLADGEMISFEFYINEGGISTGLEDIVFGEAIAVYPNPTNELLQISFTQEKIENIRIFSATGVLVSTININKHKTEVDVTHLEAGIYFIQFSNGQQNISKRFIKL